MIVGKDGVDPDIGVIRPIPSPDGWGHFGRVSEVPYTLSDGRTQDRVHAAEDDITESTVKVDTIQLKVLTKAVGTITIPLPDGVTDAGQVDVSIAPVEVQQAFRLRLQYR